MKPVIEERARTPRRGRARRPLAESLARSSALFMVLQGLALLVILAGLMLITIGMTATLGVFFSDLSTGVAARRAAEAEIPVPLQAAWTGPGNPLGSQPPMTIAQAAAATATAAVEATAAASGASGFLPYQVPADHMNQHAPPIPVTGQQPGKNDIRVPVVSGPKPTTQPIYVTATPEPSPTPVPPGPPDRLVIPAIALDAPVTPAYTQLVQLHGEVFEQWLAPNWFAAGWQQGSAQPGEVGNTVLNGHHNIDGMVFANLHKLIQGDEIVVYSGDREYHYIVSQVMNVPERGMPLEQRQENARWVLPSTDERLTLVTCWPPESNTHRIIVVAVPTR